MQLLQTVYDELVANPLSDKPAEASNGFFSRLFQRPETPVKKVKGLYLWGGVGRGKTLLTDMFYASVPFEQKSRLHFHRFMKNILSLIHI